jgi:hypothetical protein
MSKIPVPGTITAAYRFTFTHLGAIIGLIWLPMVVVTVMGFFVQQRYYAAAAEAISTNNMASLGPALVSLLFYFIAALLLYAVMYVPVVQLALGVRKEGTLVHFAFGPQEWRLFRALAGLIAFLILPIALARLLFTTARTFATAAHGVSPSLAGAGLELLAALAALGVLYVGLRFAFLLPAVAVSEEGPVLPRSWKLSEGNFWRILAVMLATMGPVLLVAALAELLLERPSLPPGANNATALAAAELHNMSANMPITQGLSFLIAPLLLGLVSSASVLAFSALKNGQDAGDA